MAIRARDLHWIRLLIPESISSIDRRLNGAASRRLSTAGENNSSEWENFAGISAYEVLGVSETSSFAEIKSNFRKLAKKTHPDVATTSNDSAGSHRFLQILAAYEILSDSKKRAHYDIYLFSQKNKFQYYPKYHSSMYTNNSSINFSRECNAAEWLKWYRLTIQEILKHKRIATGSNYFDKLENELYSAIRSAYFGPEIESMDFLPNCFEAEERSVYETSELLHLVSGRDLFGIIYVKDSNYHEKLTPFGISNGEERELCDSFGSSDTYKELELHICGRVVATASRKENCECVNSVNGQSEDHIHVFLAKDESVYGKKDLSRVLLGTISGLKTSGDEGYCSVYNGVGVKTHLIVKHRTLLVKHMHWYQVGGEVSICECRCSRACLPPSRYWLFEPRCNMHDIGGWYVETFGKDNKGRNVLSPRIWDSFIEFEKRVHPAMYLMSLAYRSLDLEETKRGKRRIGDHWYRKFL